jgi:hypothetical protein
MERTNSFELTMDDLDSVTGGLDTAAKVFVAACLLWTPFLVGAVIGVGIRKAMDA